jgi:hypothetical protein
MIKLSKKTIKSGQKVIVIDSIYKLITVKDYPWYQPQTRLIGYIDITNGLSPQCEIDSDEKLEIIGLSKEVRAVLYKRIKDGKIYSSYLGEFTTFTRLI